MHCRPWAQVGRHACLAAVVAIVASLVSGAPRASADTQPPYQLNDFGQGHVFGITPPGEDGLNNAADVLLAEGPAGIRRKHSNDLLPLYANLLYHYQGLTDQQIPEYFIDESFGVAPGKLERTEALRPDVTVYRDTHDIPHIYGQTDAAMAFGAGYVAAEDRLFFMDVLRHLGSATLTTFLGPSCADEKLDHEQLLLTGGYSHDDKLRQINDAAALDPVLGPRALGMARAYTEGINRYIAEVAIDPRKLPADYGVIDPRQHAMPQAFDLVDFVDVASVIGGQLGRGGGDETGNASLLSFLTRKFTAADASAIFRDMKQQNDPEAPTTSDFAFPYENPGTIDPSLTVLPDYVATEPSGLKVIPTAPKRTAGCDSSSGPVLPGLGLPAGDAAQVIARSVIAFPKGLSNALLVDARHSATGHPLAVFGAQTGYFAPEIWLAQDLHSPNYDAAGYSIPGISPLIEIGRGQDYAWSATSASTDNVDLRLETLCGNAAEGAPPPTSYLFEGHCIEMTHTTHTQVGVTTPACMCLPATFEQDVYTTVHGVVQGWTTTTTGGGKRQVAIVEQRSTYDREPNSVIGFLRWGTPALTHDAQSWMKGSYEIDFPFNWLYVDDRDIAYALSGRDPSRPSNLDPNLPATGDGRAEWQGFLSDAGHPLQIGSAKGYLTSWNNKPAREFSASDSQFGYGPTFRSQSLDDAILAQFAAHDGKLTQANLVTAMETAATVDLEGTRLLPVLLGDLRAGAASSGRAQEAQMVHELASWLADGAHRLRARQADDQYAHAAAVAIMDELYPRLVRAIFDPLFVDPGLPNQGVGQVDGMDARYTRVPFEWANNPNYDGQHLGSAYDGGWDGYIHKVVRQLHGEMPALPFSSAATAKMCGGGLTTCTDAIRKALSDTADILQTVNGTADVSNWKKTTASKATSLPDYDSIHYRAIGIVGQPNQHWQNRPTQQQVVLFPSHRPRDSAVSGPPLAAIAVPNTGGGGGGNLRGAILGVPGSLESMWLPGAVLSILALARRWRRRQANNHAAGR
ncbi:MAG: penicillin acylase family protein [Candidatus Dormibacteria bacterium]